MKPAVTCRIQFSFAEVIVVIPGHMGDASSVARRMRSMGLAARKVNLEVHVNGNAEVPDGIR